MSKIFKFIGLAGLILTIVPSFLYLTGSTTLDSHKQVMLIGTVLWFISAPIALKKKENS
ncbi:MAG: hypothetical protein AAFX87_03920 [Bacteroidota bacterium]